jgi:hypothetical protein
MPVEPALWKQYRAYRLPCLQKPWSSLPNNVLCLRILVESALCWKQYRELTVCHVSRSRGALYRTLAFNVQCFQMPANSVQCLQMLQDEPALWSTEPTVFRVSRSRGVLYLTMSLVSRYRLSLLHGTSSGLTVCRVSKNHGALYRTPAAASRIPSGSSPAHPSSGFAPPPPPQIVERIYWKMPALICCSLHPPPPPPPGSLAAPATQKEERYVSLDK